MKDQLYEDLLRFCFKPRTMAEILEHFPEVERYDVHNRLRKPGFYKVDYGTKYRAKGASSAKVSEREVTESIMFLAMMHMNNDPEFSFEAIIEFMLKAFNNKYDRKLELQEWYDNE